METLLQHYATQQIKFSEPFHDAISAIVFGSFHGAVIMLKATSSVCITTYLTNFMELSPS
jgi:hypothetical protein